MVGVGGRWSVLFTVYIVHTHTCHAPLSLLSGQAHASCCSLVAAGDAGESLRCNVSAGSSWGPLVVYLVSPWGFMGGDKPRGAF